MLTETLIPADKVHKIIGNHMLADGLNIVLDIVKQNIPCGFFSARIPGKFFALVGIAKHKRCGT